MKKFSFNDIDDIKCDIEIHYPLEENTDLIHSNYETIIFKSNILNIACTFYIPPIGTLFNIIPSIINSDGTIQYGSITYAGDFLVSLDPEL